MELRSVDLQPGAWNYIYKLFEGGAGELLDILADHLGAALGSMSPGWQERGTSAKNLEVRSKGASVFLQAPGGVRLACRDQVVPGSGDLLEEVLSSKGAQLGAEPVLLRGKFGAYGLPDAVQVLKDAQEEGRRAIERAS